MPPTYFKFTTSEGVNRRLTFSDPPAWPLLASKLHDLFGISLDNVGVSYIDNDNDEITVSSDEELQDFYRMSHQTDQVIKFAVVDLHFSKNKPLEFPSLNNNPFDGDAFEFDGEWEKFPTVLVTEEDRHESGPHAFVEVLSSSATHDHTDDMDTDPEDDHSTIQPPSLNKGKDRSLSFGAVSITSVLEEEMSHKHPIHVYDLNSPVEGKGKGNNSFDDPSVHIPVAAQSTPKIQAKDIDNRDTAPKAVEVEDPPLPSLDESPTSATPVSLFHDLASLVHDVTQVVSSHPELSEGLRNIGRNVSNGTYWTAHREELSNAMNNMSNPPSTEERRQAEEAATRRLTDMVGNFFRTLSEAPVNTEESRPPNVTENGSEQAHGESNAHVYPWSWWGSQMRSRGQFRPMSGFRGPHHHGYFPHGPHRPGSRSHIPPMPPHGFPHNGYPGPPPFHHAPHPAPPPPPPPPPPPADLPPSPAHDHSSPVLPPPGTAGPSLSSLMQGQVPPPPPIVPVPSGNPAELQGMRSSEIRSHERSVNDRRRSYQGPSIPFLPVPGDQPSQPNAEDSRAQLEDAKRRYKAEKERYRQERHLRRLEKLAGKATVHGSAT